MWKVTKNIIDMGEDVSILFESPGFNEALFNTKETTQFRLLDDDGNVYFEGLMWTEDLLGSEDKAFAPMDSLGTSYGCTEMQYKNNYEHSLWDTL